MSKFQVIWIAGSKVITVQSKKGQYLAKFHYVKNPTFLLYFYHNFRTAKPILMFYRDSESSFKEL